MLKENTLVIVRDNNENDDLLNYVRQIGIVICETDMSDFGIKKADISLYDIFIDNKIVCFFEYEVLPITGTSTKIIKH